MCLGLFSCWNTQLHPRPSLLLMILGFSEEYGDNPPSSLFHLLPLKHWIHSERKPVPQHNTTTTTMLHSGFGVLGVKGLTFSPPNMLLLIVAKQQQFCYIWPQRFFLFWWFLVDSWPSWPVFSQHQHLIFSVVCTVKLETCNCFETAPSDFPDLFKSIMCSFRSMLSSLDSPTVVFVAESNGSINTPC